MTIDSKTATVRLPSDIKTDSNSPPTADYAPAETSSSMPTIGKFEVRQTLGVGGQATVYLAWDPDLHRQVVIKLYHAARSVEEQEAVLREGRSLVRVENECVARCFGVDRHEGVPYLVMEYVPGQSLAKVLRQEKLSVARALEIVRDVARGLVSVHARGILHRDLKPANIMVSSDDGRPRLIDFGLALSSGLAGQIPLSGTLAYMSPEQARSDSERIDGRTDIFGLGAVFYQMLTLRPPYEAPDLDKLFSKVCAGEVTPFTADEKMSLPLVLQEFCLSCLAVAPGKRPSSAMEVVNHIDALLASQKPAGRGFRPPLIWLAAGASAGVLALLLVIGPGFFPRNPSNSPSSDPGAVVLPSNLKQPGERRLRHDFVLQAEVLGAEQQSKEAGVILHIGDAIRLKLTADRDCYVGVWSVQPDGIVQILPNSAESNHLLQAHQPRLVPGEADVPGQVGKVLRVTPSSGREMFHVVASTQPLPQAQGQQLGPYVVISDQTRSGPWQFTLRGVELVDETISNAQPLIAEAIIPYQSRHPAN